MLEKWKIEKRSVGKIRKEKLHKRNKLNKRNKMQETPSEKQKTVKK